MRKIIYDICLIVILGLAIQPVFAMTDYGYPGSATQQLVEIINRIINWMMGLLIGLAVIFIIYAGYIYLTAAGETEPYERAKTIIWYAAIAIAVALLSKGIVFIVAELVGSDLSDVL